MAKPAIIENTLATTGNGQIAKPELTISQKFVSKVSKQFEASMGTPLAWTTLQMSLAQNLYIKIDQALKDLEIKRQGNTYKKEDPPITWENVNMEKLARDAVARVKMELDAQLPNHIHVIPYLNSRTRQYDIDLRIGYMGVDHVARKFALDPPLEIKYQLVHETDVFKTKIENGIESPYFEQTSPFKPGEVIGGYGYIMYDDPRKNKLFICEYREFEKAKKASKGVEFWGGVQTEWVKENGRNVKKEGEFDEKFEKEMQFKTLVFRTCKHIKLDPAKINQSDQEVINSAQYDAIEAEMIVETQENANKETLSLETGSTASPKEHGAPAVPTTAQAETQQSLEDEANF